MKKSVVRLILAGMAFTAPSGCKPKTEDSTVKTLDNLAAGTTLRKNVCAGSPKNWGKRNLEDLTMNINVSDAGLKTRLGDEVFLAMTAVPATYVDAMSTLQVKILVTPKSHDLCTFNGQSGASKTFVSACVLAIPIGGMPEDQAMEGLSIVLAPDIGVIRHELIRSVGQVFAQVIAQRYVAQSFDGKVNFDPSRFIALQSSLAVAFLEDVANSKLFTIDNLEPMLGTGADQIARKAIAEFEAGKTKNPMAGFKTSKEKIAQFLTYVTADAFDSYYCQAEDVSKDAYDPELEARAKTGDLDAFKALQNTRLVMKNFFPATYDRFTLVNKYMGRIAVDVAALKPTTAVGEKKGSSLALTSANKSGSQDGFALTREYNASDRAYTDRRMAEYRQALASPPSYYERVRHPFENSDDRRMRIMNDYLEDRQRALNYTRMDKAAAAGTKPALINDEGASSTTWAATKGAVEGLGTGAQNVANGTKKAVVDLGTGVAGVASTAYNEGVGAAAEKVATNVSEAASNKYKQTLDAADKIGAAYGNGDIGLTRAAFELTTQTASGIPIIGNAADTARNAVAVVSETGADGKTLTYDEMTKISKDQGNVAGAAILEAGMAKGTQVIGEGTAKLAQQALQSGGKGLTSATSWVAGTLDDAAQAGRLSTLGEATANTATKAALALEKTSFQMSHATQHVLGEVVDQTVNLGVATPTYEAGKHYNDHAAGGHGAEGGHESAASEGHDFTDPNSGQGGNPFAENQGGGGGHAEAPAPAPQFEPAPEPQFEPSPAPAPSQDFSGDL